MRTWLMTVAVGASLVGCATSSTKHDASARRARPSEADDSPATASAAASTKAPLLGGSAVKILAKRPTTKQYKFVGRVEATSTSSDIVADAVKADEALQRQAAALGANVVALDVIDPPRDGSHARRHVILAGRAYREVKTN